MTRALVFLSLGALAAAQQGDPQGPQPAFVEIASPRAAYFAGEAVSIALRIGFDPAFFKANAIQTTRQDLDVRVLVEAPSLRELPGATILEEQRPDASRPRLSFALDGARTEGVRQNDRVVAGKTFVVVEVARRFAFERPGEVVIPGPTLRFSYATRFEEDLVGGRIPIDRHDATLQAADLTLTVRPLPDEGRPPGFTGAVGRFSIRAEAHPLQVEAGQSLKLKLTIAGEGDLRSFDPPRPPSLRGFRNLGMIERASALERVLTYDLAPADPDVVEIPPIAFSFFEPHPEPRYRTVRTPAIAIEVHPRSAADSAAEARSEPEPAVPAGERELLDILPAEAALAERLYRGGRFAEAQALFEAALEGGRAPAASVLYDLGNCAYRQGDFAEAVLLYRRAQLRRPRDPDVEANLRLAERKLGIEGRPLPFARSFTPGEIGAASAALLVAGLTGAFLLRGRRARAAAAVAALLGLTLAARSLHLRFAPGPREGVVLAAGVPLRDDPHAEAPVAQRLNPGVVVLVEEMSDRWARVGSARGGGWIPREAVGLVD